MTYLGYAWQSMGPHERLDRELIIVDQKKKNNPHTKHPPKSSKAIDLKQTAAHITETLLVRLSKPADLKVFWTANHFTEVKMWRTTKV